MLDLLILNNVERNMNVSLSITIMSLIILVLLIVSLVQLSKISDFKIDIRKKDLDIERYEDIMKKDSLKLNVKRIYDNIDSIIDREVVKTIEGPIMKKVMSDNNPGSPGYKGYSTINDRDKDYYTMNAYARIIDSLSKNIIDQALYVFKDEESFKTFILDELNHKITKAIIDVNTNISKDRFTT